jgi:hypothetical protein
MLGGTEGVQVWTHPNADGEVKKAADALTTALTGADVAAVVRKFQNGEYPYPGSAGSLNVLVCRLALR